MTLVDCKECGSEISDQAWACPKCGCPMKIKNLPLLYRINWWGFEWKSETTFFGLPLVHIAIGWDLNTGRLRVARGIIAIGQFGFGVITIAQFGIGLLFGLGQFIFGIVVIGQFAGGVLFALGQFAVGMYAIGQFAAGKYVTAWIDLSKI